MYTHTDGHVLMKQAPDVRKANEGIMKGAQMGLAALNAV
jgi:hypothetical protein